ncbi:MAG: sialate O-acetylesterase [Leptolyngbya sp. SIO4C1]|nr:sialate O-acetylesterase [Leptolyngbya sp. SIO4C1]
MKWWLSGTVLGAALLGTAVGILLQKYGDASGWIGSRLRDLGLYHYAYSTVAPIQTATQSAVVPPEAMGQMRLFILAGQSNMSGRAELPESSASADQIYMFGNDYRWHLAQEPVDSPAGQVDVVSLDDSAGYGPSLAFAERLRSLRSDRPVGLIPCAKGGSSIADWQRNLSDQSLYGACLKRVRAAAAMGEISGVLFFQGEADALDPKAFPSMRPAAETWATNFEQLVTDLRQDLAQPDLPVVYAQIGALQNAEKFPYWEVVRTQQEQVQLPHSRMITTSDLAMPDSAHFTQASYRTIGERFAEQLNQLL